jgi:hypothetical protein
VGDLRISKALVRISCTGCMQLVSWCSSKLQQSLESDMFGTLPALPMGRKGCFDPLISFSITFKKGPIHASFKVNT